MTASPALSPLVELEPRLRYLLPADLYAHAWIEPTAANLLAIFEHLRTLQRILQDYTPRLAFSHLSRPGEVRHEWQEGTLMFTDLAGFTPLMEAHAAQGRAGAESMLELLNSYFAEMLEIISKSGGTLLEFTGDAMLVQFLRDGRNRDTQQAIHAGLRMQRAMVKFADLATTQSKLSLGMRIGIHTGRYLMADIGTPRRMEHVLLGEAVQKTKRAEGAGKVGRVSVSPAACERVAQQFRLEPGSEGHMLVVDDLSAEVLGEYDIALRQRRASSAMLLDRSIPGLLAEIERSLATVEPLAAFIPAPILNLLIETATHRRIPPDFLEPTVMLVNLLGLAEAIEQATPLEAMLVINMFSRAMVLINAAVEARGGMLRKITYHLAGPDILICFGVPNAHTNNAERMAHAALVIRDIIHSLQPPVVGGQALTLTCQMGIAHGAVFAAEIGEPRGRREFNILSDTVNTAARLMGKANPGQILISEVMARAVDAKFKTTPLGAMTLKGKKAQMPIFELVSPRADT